MNAVCGSDSEATEWGWEVGGGGGGLTVHLNDLRGDSLPRFTLFSILSDLYTFCLYVCYSKLFSCLELDLGLS